MRPHRSGNIAVRTNSRVHDRIRAQWIERDIRRGASGDGEAGNRTGVLLCDVHHQHPSCLQVHQFDTSAIAVSVNVTVAIEPITIGS